METARRIRDSIEPTPSIASQAYRLQRTLEAARLLHSTLDLKQLTAIILEIVRNEVPVDRVSAFVVDRKENVLRSLIAQGVDGPLSTPIGEGIAGFVAETCQALDVQDAYADARFNPDFDRLLGYRTNDIFALPILSHEGNVIGVLELLNRKHPIRQEDREFLQDVSVFIGLALENSRMHEEAQHRARLEEELVRTRERLAQIDRLVLIGEVLSTVMNELTTPASVVLRHAALLKLDPGVTAGMLRNIGIIESATTRSQEAVSTFLEFIQKQKGERGPVDVTGLVEQTIASRAPQWVLDRIEVDQRLEATPPIVGNYAELQQALIHLIKNAEDAMTSREGERRLAIRLSHDARQGIRIDIQDSGEGIFTELYERIFEPFFSTKRDMVRAGLGLTIANRIIQEHNGEILFETTPGQGSTFTIELPV
ncbi:MAG: GAF domain-containing sensor histidine kinase [Acidobacteria bacterium]|nr:GAF domain-containing sensor histidine kinase [Acidobacteriota bacterium]